MKHIQCPNCKNSIGWDYSRTNIIGYGRGILKCKHCDWKEQPPYCKKWINDGHKKEEILKEQEKRQDIYWFNLCNFINETSDQEAYIEDGKIKLESTWYPIEHEFDNMLDVLKHLKYDIRDLMMYISEEGDLDE